MNAYTPKIALRHTGQGGARDLAAYRREGGYGALARALEGPPEAVLKEVERSELRGRGGAGFPVALKWSSAAGYRKPGVPLYLVCNADEGEPGTFKDRRIIENEPHLLIEGMLIAAYTVGASQGFVYVRGEFARQAAVLERAAAEARAAGCLGHDVMGSGFSFDLVVFRGAGAYICGEETALLESLEGRRGQPRKKPPYPTENGLFGRPTVVNNVETFAYLPHIVAHGGEAFAEMGAGGGAGVKLYCLSGHVERPGVYEYPHGVSLGVLIEEAGGGVRGGGRLKAVIPGGLSTPILTADEIDVTMDFDGLQAAGSALGSGGIIVLDESVSIPWLAWRASRFYLHESCGQCAPCREGTGALERLLRRLHQGQSERDDLAQIDRLCRGLRGLTLCPMGDAAAGALGAMVEKFRGEFEALKAGGWGASGTLPD